MGHALQVTSTEPCVLYMYYMAQGQVREGFFVLFCFSYTLHCIYEFKIGNC